MASATNIELFDRLVRPHFDRLYRLAFRLTGEQTRAEDLFQELLTRAFTKLDEIVALDDPGPWLSRVMYNLFVDERRRFARRRLRMVGEAELPGGRIDELAGTGGPRAESERDETYARLGAALDQLAEDQRIVVLLHDTEGYKLKEIQELTGLAIGTIKSRLHRARSRLRQILTADGTFS
jgi:RNA polymerase sigma-70 factor (ECF subfamily)